MRLWDFVFLVLFLFVIGLAIAAQMGFHFSIHLIISPAQGAAGEAIQAFAATLGKSEPQPLPPVPSPKVP